jgi:uncharacterized protein
MALDILLLILAWLALLIGLAGSVLPIPGPPVSFVGLLFLHWSRFADFTAQELWTLGLLTVLVTALDMLVPLWGVKRFGGSRYGVWGSVLGLLIGLGAGPWGIFAGAFLGGLAGELLAGRSTSEATRAAFGSFIGFLFGMGLKLVLCSVMIWYAVAAMVRA